MIIRSPPVHNVLHKRYLRSLVWLSQSLLIFTVLMLFGSFYEYVQH